MHGVKEHQDLVVGGKLIQFVVAHQAILSAWIRWLPPRASLTAPGALVTTSTRPDVLEIVVEHRETMGTIWV